ncbi:MAG: hypothetical protein JO259_01715, partial [Mycobacterium sp.]|nr:hypothetical protein [Mycobacterium sp.]
VHAVVDEVLLGDPRIGLVIDRLDEGLAERGSAGERVVDALVTALLFPLGQRRHHRNGLRVAC